MGSIIAQKLSQRKDEYAVIVFDKDKVKLNNLNGVKIAENVQELLERVDTVVLAIKPQDFDHLLKEIKKFVNGKLIISIAAGISAGHIERILGNVRVIRVMPNIAARIEESVTCLCGGSFAKGEDIDIAQEIFYFLGTTRVIEEKMMNAATAISGSGPAYVFYFLENSIFEPENIPEHARHDMMRRLEKAAQDLGFDLETAAFLAANTVNASISLLHKTKMPAQELRAQVTSKGGTTEAAINILSKGGSWEEAAQAALKRADELAKRS
jgi:pyrroline-5-carboxylate reductase